MVAVALRGATAVAIVSTIAGVVPRGVRIGLSVGVGLWTALVVGRSAVAPGRSPWLLAAHEVVIGAALGMSAAIPLLVASAAGRLVDAPAWDSRRGPHGALFAVLGAAVFVGVDGHVAVVAAIVDSHRSVSVLGESTPSLLSAVMTLFPAAISIAMPWLVAVAVVHLAIGVGVRVGARGAAFLPAAAAVPASLVMMTAALVSTAAIAIARLVGVTTG